MLIVTAILLMIIISISGCIDNNGNNDKNNDEYEWNVEIIYSVEIVQNNYTEYTLYIPIIGIGNGSSIEIFENIKIIEGNGKLELINTTKDLALAVYSSSPNFKFESKLEKYKSIYIRMRNSTTYNDDDYWVFCNNTRNETIELKIFIRGQNSKGGGVEFLTIPEFQKISNGWNKIYMRSDAWDT